MGATIFMMRAKSGLLGISPPPLQYILHCGLTADSFLLINLEGLGSIKLCNYVIIYQS